MASSRASALAVAVVLVGAAVLAATPPEPVPESPGAEQSHAVTPVHATPGPAAAERARRARDPRPETTGKVVYLTFDDGPHRVWTPEILAVLDRHDADATFFLLGREATARPDLVAAIRRAGHTVGNHTVDHRHLTRLPADQVRRQIALGPPSRCFRPPFRETDRRIQAIASGFGQRQVLWDVDTEDWRRPGAAAVERAVVRGARPGAIVLLHDGGGDRSQTVTALDRALTRLAGAGYRFRALDC